MRRFLIPTLAGLAAFMLVTGILVKFYAYPRLAVVALDQNGVVKLEATDAEIFDTTTLQPLRTDLSVASRTVGDVKASQDHGEGVRVWVSTTSIRSGDGTVRSRSTERTAFDAHSAEAVNCCGAFRETVAGDRIPTKRSGLVFKFPFDTQKKTYNVWDGTLDGTSRTRYVKESAVQGLNVYVFETEVPRTKVGTSEVPASVLEEPGDGNIEAESYYTAKKIYLVEPVTGAIVNQSISQDSTLAVDGSDRITVTKATLKYTKATVDKNVKDLKPQASSLSLVQNTIPITAIVLGLVLAALALVLRRRAR